MTLSGLPGTHKKLTGAVVAALYALPVKQEIVLVVLRLFKEPSLFH